MTDNKSREVISETLKNMEYLDLYRLLNNLCKDKNVSVKTMEYLRKNHKYSLDEAMEYLEV